jgi:hypothetical protein
MWEDGFQFNSMKHCRCSPSTPDFSCCNTGPLRNGPYWILREEGLELIELSSTQKV